MIKSVSVQPGCISCGTCERICPLAFKVQGTSQVITEKYAGLEEKLVEAEANCPVNVIKVEQEGDDIILSKSHFYYAKLIRIRELTDDVIEYTLRCKKKFPYKPGQFITIAMKDEQSTFMRSYSVVSYEKKKIVLCIKLNPKSRSSAFLRTKTTGDKFIISPPKGVFVINEPATPKFFVATGTGIAPMMAIMKSLPDVPKFVLFGVRHEQDIFYEEEIKSIPKTKLVYSLSQPTASWGGLIGRVTEHLKKANVPRNADIYVCGNPSMVEQTVSFYESLRIPDNRIFFEKFTKQPDAVSGRVEVKNWLKRLIFDGEIPFFTTIQKVIYYSSFGIFLGLPFLHSGFRELGTQGWYVLIAVLLIRPIAELFPSIVLFTKLIPLRKELGILSAVLIWAHSYGYFLDNNINPVTELGKPYLWDFTGYYFWGVIGLIVALLLLLTSNKWSVQIMDKWWKRIQRLAYIFFIMGAIHVMIIHPIEIIKWSIIITLIFGLRILVYVKKSLIQPA